MMFDSVLAEYGNKIYNVLLGLSSENINCSKVSLENVQSSFLGYLEEYKTRNYACDESGENLLKAYALHDFLFNQGVDDSGVGALASIGSSKENRELYGSSLERTTIYTIMALVNGLNVYVVESPDRNYFSNALVMGDNRYIIDHTDMECPISRDLIDETSPNMYPAGNLVVNHINGWGITLLMDGNFPNSIANFGTSIKKNPDHPVAYAYRALARLELKEYGLAKEDIDVSFKLTGMSPEYYMNYFVLGSLYNALANLHNANDIVSCLEESGDVGGMTAESFRQAEKAFTKAIDLCDDPDSYYLRAQVREKLGDLDGSLEDMNHLIEILPNDDPMKENARRFRENIQKWGIMSII